MLVLQLYYYLYCQGLSIFLSFITVAKDFNIAFYNYDKMLIYLGNIDKNYLFAFSVNKY